MSKLNELIDIKEIKLTLQNYKNALGIFSEYLNNRYDVDFSGYCETRMKELEQPKILMYRCIQVRPAINGMFEILGQLYPEDYCIAGFNLADLPNHFELVEPEPEPEKITWMEVKALIQDIVSSGYWPPIPKSLPLIEAINRIKTDHL